VEIQQIQRELKSLWDDGAGGMTRASLINFALCFRGAASIRRIPI
jgi:hypothetical protein